VSGRSNRGTDQRFEQPVLQRHLGDESAANPDHTIAALVIRMARPMRGILSITLTFLHRAPGRLTTAA
jgi:hypothetical protein